MLLILRPAQRAIGEAHSKQQAVRLKLARIKQNDILVPAKCENCKILNVDRVWKDLGGVALCKLCRRHEERKRHRKRLEKKIDAHSRSLCGTHAAESSAWSSSENGSRRCRWCNSVMHCVNATRIQTSKSYAVKPN